MFRKKEEFSKEFCEFIFSDDNKSLDQFIIGDEVGIRVLTCIKITTAASVDRSKIEGKGCKFTALPQYCSSFINSGVNKNYDLYMLRWLINFPSCPNSAMVVGIMTEYTFSKEEQKFDKLNFLNLKKIVCEDLKEVSLEHFKSLVAQVENNFSSTVNKLDILKDEWLIGVIVNNKICFKVSEKGVDLDKKDMDVVVTAISSNESQFVLTQPNTIELNSARPFSEKCKIKVELASDKVHACLKNTHYVEINCVKFVKQEQADLIIETHKKVLDWLNNLAQNKHILQESQNMSSIMSCSNTESGSEALGTALQKGQVASNGSSETDSENRGNVSNNAISKNLTKGFNINNSDGTTNGLNVGGGAGIPGVANVTGGLTQANTSTTTTGNTEQYGLGQVASDGKTASIGKAHSVVTSNSSSEAFSTNLNIAHILAASQGLSNVMASGWSTGTSWTLSGSEVENLIGIIRYRLNRLSEAYSCNTFFEEQNYILSSKRDCVFIADCFSSYGRDIGIKNTFSTDDKLINSSLLKRVSSYSFQKLANMTDNLLGDTTFSNVITGDETNVCIPRKNILSDCNFECISYDTGVLSIVAYDKGDTTNTVQSMYDVVKSGKYKELNDTVFYNHNALLEVHNTAAFLKYLKLGYIVDPASLKRTNNVVLVSPFGHKVILGKTRHGKTELEKLILKEGLCQDGKSIYFNFKQKDVGMDSAAVLREHSPWEVDVFSLDGQNAVKFNIFYNPCGMKISEWAPILSLLLARKSGQGSNVTQRMTQAFLDIYTLFGVFDVSPEVASKTYSSVQEHPCYQKFKKMTTKLRTLLEKLDNIAKIDRGQFSLTYPKLLNDERVREVLKELKFARENNIDTLKKLNDELSGLLEGTDVDANYLIEFANNFDYAKQSSLSYYLQFSSQLRATEDNLKSVLSGDINAHITEGVLNRDLIQYISLDLVLFYFQFSTTGELLPSVLFSKNNLTASKVLDSAKRLIPEIVKYSANFSENNIEMCDFFKNCKKLSVINTDSELNEFKIFACEIFVQYWFSYKLGCKSIIEKAREDKSKENLSLSEYTFYSRKYTDLVEKYKLDFETPLNIIIEESNTLFASSEGRGSAVDSGFAESGTSIWEDVLVKGAGFKLFLTFIAQTAQSLPSYVLSQSNDVFMVNSSSSEDNEFVISNCCKTSSKNDISYLDNCFNNLKVGKYIHIQTNGIPSGIQEPSTVRLCEFDTIENNFSPSDCMTIADCR